MVSHNKTCYCCWVQVSSGAFHVSIIQFSIKVTLEVLRALHVVHVKPGIGGSFLRDAPPEVKITVFRLANVFSRPRDAF